MGRARVLGAVILVLSSLVALFSSSCFSGSNSNGSATATAVEVVKPQPRVENVVATTSGSPSAYYATLDIKIKNVGAEGTVLVQAAVTQNGKTSSNEMPVFLKKNETHELKLTFPLVWQGGDFTSSVKTIVP
jgi:hypothetical protein